MAAAGPWLFWVVGSNPTFHNEYFSSDFSLVEVEKYSTRYPQEIIPLGYGQVRPYILSTCYPAVSGERA